MRKVLRWGPPLLFFGIVLVFSLTFYYRAPYHDHWSIVPLYNQMQDGRLSVADLFTLHGLHWHASGYIVQLALSPLTSMGHWAESLVSVFLAGIGFLALVRILKRAETPSAMAWLLAVSAVFLFSLDQAGNWLWGWQVAVFINLAGTLWAIERLSCGPPSLGNTALAIIASAIAIYAFATGWALIPIGWFLLSVFGGWQSPRGRLSLLLWTLFVMAIGWHYYLANRALVSIHGQMALPPLLEINTLLGLAHYTLNYIASPIVRFARDISVPITFLGAGLLVFAVKALRQDIDKSVLIRVTPLLALAAYASAAGVLTALGRWQAYGVKQAFVSRYITFGNLFWIAVFALVIIVIARQRDRRHRVLYSLLGLLFLLKIGNVPSVVQKSVRLSNQIQVASEIVAETYPNTPPEAYAVFHSPIQRIESELAVLYDHRVSLFSDVPEDDDVEPKRDINTP